jgi:hypothetical protein
MQNQLSVIAMPMVDFKTTEDGEFVNHGNRCGACGRNYANTNYPCEC